MQLAEISELIRVAVRRTSAACESRKLFDVVFD